jgi:DNA helicase-2/ATP-dependent DNA helicase PcrA
VSLETNYRSTPEVLRLANRVLAAGRVATDERGPGTAPRPPKRLVPSLPSGPAPEIGGFATDEAELAGITSAIRRLAAAGTPHGSMAILVRTNAALPAVEGALGAAGIPFHVRGERFFARPEVRRAIRVAEALGRVQSDEPLSVRLATAFERELGVRRDAAPEGGIASERHGAVVTLLELADDLARADPAADMAAFLTEVARRTAIEAGGEAAGVELLTYHRAKGLEWDAVFLPALEEGTLPIRQSTEPLELAEERRLLYVGITRARHYLWLSWATSRIAASGREGRRSRSRFLDGLVPASAGRVRVIAPAGAGTSRSGPGAVDPADRSPLSNALRAWRTARAKADAVAPFIVFHDATIEAIASRRPRSIAELRRVPGVGPTKLDRYGEEIIGVVVRAG